MAKMAEESIIKWRQLPEVLIEFHKELCRTHLCTIPRNHLTPFALLKGPFISQAWTFQHDEQTDTIERYKGLKGNNPTAFLGATTW